MRRRPSPAGRRSAKGGGARATWLPLGRRRDVTTAATFVAASSAPSVSRIPACALTISASAPEAEPSPYGSERPWRQTVGLRDPGRPGRRVADGRDFPMPGTPTTVDQLRLSRAPARARAPTSTSRSSSRPTSGVRASERTIPQLAPRRARARREAAPPSPSRYRLLRLVLDRTPGRPKRLLADEDAAWRRRGLEARSRCSRRHPPRSLPELGRASSATTASPVFTPIRTSSASFGSASFIPDDRAGIASAARTARSGIVVVGERRSGLSRRRRRR